MVHSEIKAKPGQLGWSWARAWQKSTGMRRVKRDVNFIVLVHVTIGRRLLSLILTTILPTLLLNLIRHTAN